MPVCRRARSRRDRPCASRNLSGACRCIICSGHAHRKPRRYQLARRTDAAGCCMDCRRGHPQQPTAAAVAGHRPRALPGAARPQRGKPGRTRAGSHPGRRIGGTDHRCRHPRHQRSRRPAGGRSPCRRHHRRAGPRGQRLHHAAQRRGPARWALFLRGVPAHPYPPASGTAAGAGGQRAGLHALRGTASHRGAGGGTASGAGARTRGCDGTGTHQALRTDRAHAAGCTA